MVEPVTVFSKANCSQCAATTRALDKAGVDYTYIDMGDNLELVAELKARGFQQAPVVMVGEEGQTAAWGGYRPDLIKQVITSPQSAVPVPGAAGVVPSFPVGTPRPSVGISR